MKRAQKIAEENRKQEICVTYDLAIAKIALQLQEEEAPKFDNVFVVLGGFQIEMAAFAVFGEYIAESGGPDILNKSQIIEKESLKSFISGKGYKRTKRAHQLLALAMEILHFQSFLESKETFDTIGREIFNLEANDSCDLNLSKELLKIFKEYEEYQKKTENGIHGKTAQYWLYKNGSIISSVYQKHKNWRFRAVYILLKKVI